jgi:hypothetical protein
VAGPVLNLTRRDVALDELVLYVRAGAVLTLQRDVIQHSGQVGGALLVHVYAGADGRFVMVEDDGESEDYATAPETATRSTTWSWTDGARALCWTISGAFNGTGLFTAAEALLFVNGTAAPQHMGPVPLAPPGGCFQF